MEKNKNAVGIDQIRKPFFLGFVVRIFDFVRYIT